MSFRGVSLAAGLATRLRPLTDNIPKAKLPILGIPSLYFSFWQFRRLGLKSWAVNCHHHSEVVKKLVSDWPFNEEIFVSEEQDLQGSGGCYPLLNDWRQGDHLIVYNPDIMCDFDLEFAVKHFERHLPAALIVCLPLPPPGGIPSVHIGYSERVIGVGAKAPLGTSASLYGAAIFLFHSDFLNQIPRGNSSLSTHLTNAINSGEKVIALTHDGFWIDMGDSHERYFLAQRQSLSHYMTNPDSIFSIALSNLWSAVGSKPKIIQFPNDPKSEATSFISKNAYLSGSAKIGPSCFVYGEPKLESGFIGSHCMIGGDKSLLLTGESSHKIVYGDVRIDLPIQMCE